MRIVYIVLDLAKRAVWFIIHNHPENVDKQGGKQKRALVYFNNTFSVGNADVRAVVRDMCINK